MDEVREKIFQLVCDISSGVLSALDGSHDIDSILDECFYNADPNSFGYDDLFKQAKQAIQDLIDKKVREHELEFAMDKAQKLLDTFLANKSLTEPQHYDMSLTVSSWSLERGNGTVCH